MTSSIRKRGDSSFEGFSGVVYEPDDEYKGDLARSYLRLRVMPTNVLLGVAVCLALLIVVLPRMVAMCY